MKELEKKPPNKAQAAPGDQDRSQAVVLHLVVEIATELCNWQRKQTKKTGEGTK